MIRRLIEIWWGPASMLTIALVLFSWHKPAPSSIGFSDWQAWAALCVAFLCSFLTDRADYATITRGAALWMGGFMIARLLFW